MSSFAVGMALSYEDRGMINRCITMAKQAYKDALTDLIILDVESKCAKYVKETYGAVVLKESSLTPIFIKHQRMIEYFLDNTKATHFIKIDPDTIILRWDRKFPDLAGQFAKYKPEHQQARWRSMPEAWREANRGFERKQYLHGINGGYSLISREICEKIRHFFFKQEIEWPVGLLRTGARKETPDVECMIGEEHSIAWYLHRVGIAAGYCETVDQKQEKYYTYKGNIDKIKKPERLHVFHPVKTEATFKKLLSVTQVEKPTEPSTFNKSIALGLVVSYESRERVECAILLAQYAYRGCLSDIILVSKGFKHCDYFVEKYGTHIIEDEEIDAAYFVSIEKLYKFFLENSTATHVVSIDADTACLRWDSCFPEIAGERVSFKYRWQRETYTKMPEEWQKKNRDFENVGCIHAIQGAYVVLSRIIVERMSRYFFLQKEQWNSEVKPAEEQIIGYYLRKILKEDKKPTSLVGCHDIQEAGNYKYVVTPHRKDQKIRGDKVHVYHPVKTNEQLLSILKLCGDYGDTLRDYLIERGIEL